MEGENSFPSRGWHQMSEFLRHLRGCWKRVGRGYVCYLACSECGWFLAAVQLGHFGVSICPFFTDLYSPAFLDGFLCPWPLSEMDMGQLTASNAMTLFKWSGSVLQRHVLTLSQRLAAVFWQVALCLCLLHAILQALVSILARVLGTAVWSLPNVTLLQKSFICFVTGKWVAGSGCRVLSNLNGICRVKYNFCGTLLLQGLWICSYTCWEIFCCWLQ